MMHDKIFKVEREGFMRNWSNYFPKSGVTVYLKYRKIDDESFIQVGKMVAGDGEDESVKVFSPTQAETIEAVSYFEKLSEEQQQQDQKGEKQDGQEGAGEGEDGDESDDENKEGKSDKGQEGDKGDKGDKGNEEGQKGGDKGDKGDKGEGEGDGEGEGEGQGEGKGKGQGKDKGQGGQGGQGGQDAGTGSKQATLEEILEQFNKEAKEGKGAPSDSETYEEAEKKVENRGDKGNGEGDGQGQGDGDGQGQRGERGEKGDGGYKGIGDTGTDEGGGIGAGENKDFNITTTLPESQIIIEAVEDAFDIQRGDLSQVITTKRKVMDRIKTFLNDAELQKIAAKGGMSGDRTEILTIIDNALTKVYE